MKTLQYRDFKKIIKSERGAVLIISLLMLVILTIIGVAATNTSIIEILTSDSSKKKQAAFYAAEAGVQHAKVVLTKMLNDNNYAPGAGAGTSGNWSFLFDDDSELDDVDYPVAPGEKYLIKDYTFGDYKYTITVYDPEYDPSNTTGLIDTDGIIYLRSISQSDKKGNAGIEVALRGFVGTTPPKGGRIMNYSAQAKFGSGKASAGSDVVAMTAAEIARQQANVQL